MLNVANIVSSLNPFDAFFLWHTRGEDEYKKKVPELLEIYKKFDEMFHGKVPTLLKAQEFARRHNPCIECNLDEYKKRTKKPVACSVFCVHYLDTDQEKIDINYHGCHGEVVSSETFDVATGLIIESSERRSGQDDTEGTLQKFYDGGRLDLIRIIAQENKVLEKSFDGFWRISCGQNMHIVDLRCTAPEKKETKEIVETTLPLLKNALGM